jgi:hypothetical protein
MLLKAFPLLVASVISFGTISAPAVLGTQCASAEPKAADLKPLTVDQVAAKLHTPKFFVFDANDKDMWAAGHVPGAKWVDDEHVTAADLPADKTATLVFYCHNET